MYNIIAFGFSSLTWLGDYFVRFNQEDKQIFGIDTLQGEMRTHRFCVPKSKM